MLSKISNTIQDYLAKMRLQNMPIILSASIGLVLLYLSGIDDTMTEFFDRAIGGASMKAIDAPIRVEAFWTSLMILIASFLVLNFLVITIGEYVKKKYGEHFLQLEREIFFELGLVMLINLVLSFNGVIRDFTDELHSKLLILLIVATGVVALHTLLKILEGNKLTKNHAQIPLLTAAAFILPLSLTCFVQLFVSRGTNTIAMYSITSLVIYLILFVAVRLVLFRVQSINVTALIYALIPVSLMPLSYILSNELQYTLTKHNIVLSPKVIATAFGALLLLIGMFVYWKNRNKTNERTANAALENFVLPTLLVTLGIFAVHVQVMTLGSSFDMLHTGNQILWAQQLYQFGNLPFVDILPHQPYGLGALLYMLINGYNLLEPLVWNNLIYIIPVVLIIYFLLKQLLGARWAALLMCFTPVILYANPYYIVGLLPLLFVKQMREKRNTLSYFLLLFASVIACVYQLSSGKIAVIASVAMLCLSISSKKQLISALKALLFAYVIPLTIGLTVLVARGNNFFDWLTLLMAANKSDILIGSFPSFIADGRSLFEVTLYYGLFPLLALIFGFLALKNKEKSYSLNKNFKNYCIAYLCMAAIICSLRAFARHSQQETLPIDYYPLLCVLIPCFVVKSKTVQRIATTLVIVFFTLTPYVALSSGDSNLAAVGLKDFTFHAYQAGEVRCDTLASRGYPHNLRKALDMVLTEDQTFFEGVNSYLLYALMERECTLSIACAWLIQTETSQEAYLRELEKLYEQNKVPIIIYGSDSGEWGMLDGAPSELGLFKLSEFIYTHYEPWIIVDDFHLWKAKNSGIDIELPEDVTVGELPILNASTTTSDLTVSEDNDTLVLDCGSIDPSIHFLLDTPMEIDNADEMEIEIAYTSTIAGDLQVFFDFGGLIEADSRHAEISATEDTAFTYLAVPHSELGNVLHSLRLDPPLDAQFQIKSINFVKRPLVYTLAETAYSDWNLQLLPYVWGNFDEKVNENFPEELYLAAENIALDAGKNVAIPLAAEVDKSSGNYLYFRINAAQDGTVSISYGDNNANGCTFDVVAGSVDYLVRISSQYDWVAKPQTKMTVTASNPVTLERVSVLKGD